MRPVHLPCSFIFAVCTLSLSFGCSTSRVNPKGSHQRHLASAQAAHESPEFQEFVSLMEEALVWRAKASEFAFLVKDSLAGGHLTPDQLIKLHESGRAYIALRARILQIVSHSEWMVAPHLEVTFAPRQGTDISKAKHPNGGFVRLFKGKTTISIDPSDAEGLLLLDKLKTSLAAALVLYDNYLVGIYPYYENSRIRYLINKDDPEMRDELTKVTSNFVDRKSRKKVAKALSLIEKSVSWQRMNGINPTYAEKYLEMLISQSPTYNYLLQKKFNKIGPDKFSATATALLDNAGFLSRAFVYVTSMVFGNAVGLVEFRKGYLMSLPEQERAEIAAELQPLDILQEKTPFRLTDKFIPGHYGHVAIWTGNEEQIKALGVWDHSAIIPHQNAIREGRRIIEALRPGVEINTLDHFLNIDDILALRMREPELTFEQKQEYLVRAFQQVGKAYDFNFDIETNERIVCSELAYVVYHNIEWPTDKTLGRYTISPDHVAIKGIPGGPLMPVLMYHDGKKVNGNLAEILHHFLNGDYEAANKLINE
ncbi:MAG TPA: YiiX/YebB-like N1pC/P60 family cysteine hydrolase [Bdellovibrionota bacterium]|nr:YiiX/YebB-like N1pC/P60 family cysteine hydrolase [Bdellovibrionota bacterium]